MKTLITIFASSILLALYSCNKNLISVNPKGSGTRTQNTSVNFSEASIAGNWNIVTDSTYAGAGYSNHPVNYTGQPGDYFNITTSGVIYTKEGSQLDTLSYQIKGDTAIIISTFGATVNGVPAISHIKNLSQTTLVIASPVFLTPGGVFSRKVALSR